jgi:hypothetical protein
MRHGQIARLAHVALAQKDEAVMGRMIGGAATRLAR